MIHTGDQNQTKSIFCIALGIRMFADIWIDVMYIRGEFELSAKLDYSRWCYDLCIFSELFTIQLIVFLVILILVFN